MWGYNQGRCGQCRPVRLTQCAVTPSTCPRACKPGTSYAPSCTAEKNYRWTCPPKFESRRSCSAPPRKRLTIEFTAPERRTSKQPRRPKSVDLEPTVIRLSLEKRTVSKIPKREVPNQQPPRPQKLQKASPPKVENSKSGTTQTNKSLAQLEQPNNKIENVPVVQVQQYEDNIENTPAEGDDVVEESYDDEEDAVEVSSQKSEGSENASVKTEGEEAYADEKFEEDVEPQGETGENDSFVCDTEKCGEDISSQKSKSNESASIKDDGKGEFCDNEKCAVDDVSHQSKGSGSVSMHSGEKGEYCDNPTCGMDEMAQKSKSSATESLPSGETEQYCDNPKCGMDDGSLKSRSSGSGSIKSGEKIKKSYDNEKYRMDEGLQKRRTSGTASMKSGGSRRSEMEGVPQKPRGSGATSVKSIEKIEYYEAEIRERSEIEDVLPKIRKSPPIRIGEKLSAPCDDNVEDHEYLHFLLGITEDILRSNTYTNKGMDEVFQSHLKANRGRLDEKRMCDAIEQLKKELNYPLGRSTKSICQCNRDRAKFREDCKCCPGFFTDPTTNAKGSCICLNPDCPGKKIDERPSPKLDATDKCEPEELSPIEEDQKLRFLSISEYENVTRQSGDTPVNFGEPVAHEEDEKNVFHQSCMDPANCSVPETILSPSKRSPSDKSKVLFEENQNGAQDKNTMSIETSKISSAIRMVDGETKEKLSQMFFLNSMGEVCHCTAALRKTALKIQADEQDKNQEYIVVDGPVCMPKTMLEERTIPVMIENASAMFMDSDLDVRDTHGRGSRTPSLSRVNLLMHDQEDQEDFLCKHDLDAGKDFTESISFEIRDLTKAKKTETDYDMTPEREMVAEEEEQMVKTTVVEAPCPEEWNLSTVETVEATLVPEEHRHLAVTDVDNPSKESFDTQSIPNSDSLADAQLDVIKSDEPLIWEESKTPSLFDVETEERQDYDGVDHTIVDKIFVSSVSQDITASEDEEYREAPTSKATASSAPSKSSSGRICDNTRCSSRESSKESISDNRSEGELSGDDSDFSMQKVQTLQLHKPTRGKSNSSELRKRAAAAPAVISAAEPDKSDGDRGRHRAVDERPSQRHGSDFENKYHYLLQDASTSMTSADFYRVEDFYEAPVTRAPVIRAPVLSAPVTRAPVTSAPVTRTLLPIPTAPPLASYDVHGDGSFEEPKLSFELRGDKYKLPSSAVEIQAIPVQPIKVNSSDIDEDKRSMPRVFDYSTHPTPMKSFDSQLTPSTNKVGKPFEYAYPRKRGSHSGSSDMMSSISKPSDEVQNVLPPTYAVESKTSTDGASSGTSLEYQIKDDASSDHLKESETSIPRKDVKVWYTSTDEAEPYDHQEIIKKLDEIPEQDYVYNQQNTVKNITDKLQEFRTIDRNENTRKFQYVNPEENFEIRRASLEDEKPDENFRNAPKPKPTCCGLGQRSKRAR